ncbi:Phage protein, HK97 gp10 family [Tepidanaerobacter acetatoxydans Re1]|uniref:Phage protein, HK97 gp10 family n=1 Tax=Tepidanaerobacter acetatoxydans (strain DSM 21804 / JCM 16047 / Re1) TaxID=1209989 RepID=F4LSD9_TEPAE|nr:HK97-gp10 family putative phage morphogenesis protein [Tepidanaerobacter acetatoxydans]AEE91205.1 phage protein, HK97 gp10 family [Tepidanaerobacter acetatoxydans Re1]CCP25876.1 Phage protein, HK97 gp10 family [Tepidanaerobacter acetatoxydans Re1]
MSSVQGIDRLLKKLNSLGGDVNKAVKRGVTEATRKIQRDAKDFAPFNYGQLKDGIVTEIIEEEDKIVGIVKSTAGHNQYVEFGTGPVGRASPKDLPPGINPKYVEGMWWIHESQIDPDVAEKYGFIKIETEQGVFYGTYGQRPHPYMYPAMKQNEKYVKETIKGEVRMEIKKVGK